MSSQLITKSPWSVLTRSVRSHKGPCVLAVAFLGQGGAKMLPLRVGSRVVVDASEVTVKRGLTCPAELIKLQRRGVEIFTVTNLHAKVYVVGSGVFIGSANVSGNAASILVEAVLHTTERKSVADARSFIEGLCFDKLGPERLRQLAKIYRHPQFPGGKRGKRKAATQSGKVDLRLAQLDNSEPWPLDEECLLKAGQTAARKLRQHRPSTHCLDEFRWTGVCGFKRNQQVIQITSDADGKTWVYPPAYVLRVSCGRRKSVNYVHVEYPKRNRMSLERFAARVGRGAVKKLEHSGPVKDKAFALSLLKAWNG